MIRKLLTVKNMAVFKNFDWNKTVKNNGGVVDFDRINVIYGRNYSGKTTTSRIFRAMETGSISQKYINPVFEVEFNGGNKVTQANLSTHDKVIRVFNDDFVKENLRFISNSDESIKSFAILGDDNNKIEMEIEEKGRLLGAEDSGIGLLGVLKNKQSAHDAAMKLAKKSQVSLDSILTDKANKSGTGIKHNKLYGDANYNVVKLKNDIAKVSLVGYCPILDDKADELKNLIKEELKPDIPKTPSLRLSFADLVIKVKDLAEKKVNLSEPIQELLGDTLLQEWVRSGKGLHQEKRSVCGFCGSHIPVELWNKLDKHFNTESETLRTNIQSLLTDIGIEISKIEINIDPSLFYSAYSNDVSKLKTRLDKAMKDYVAAIDKLKKLLTERLGDIFCPLTVPEMYDVSLPIYTVLNEYELIRTASNELSKSLNQKQKEARESLRLADIYHFLADIKYSAEISKNEKLKSSEDKSKSELMAAQSNVDEVTNQIIKLRAQLKDESKGADKVNEYLNNFFGHEHLSLAAVEGESGYRFEVTRDGKKAHHLSEGECSLVAFCYFMAKLNDIDTKNLNPIVWIDDPISSLDSNHVFFVFSIINSELVKNGKFKQLFISTHSLDFLKYLKRLIPKDSTGKHLERRYFVIERDTSGSHIRVMPKYLKSYVTEFNYLFHQIYKCANASLGTCDDSFDVFYNYGNNVRKFLEAFLYYKYPNANDKDENKLARFFGDDTVSTVLTERISNEYSHLAGVFERSIVPIDVPEMKKTAQFILDKIKEKDPDQFSALLESIDIATPPATPAATPAGEQAAIPF